MEVSLYDRRKREHGLILLFDRENSPCSMALPWKLTRLREIQIDADVGRYRGRPISNECHDRLRF